MKKILIMLLLVFLLSSCQKKSNSLNNLEECITNLCDDDDIGADNIASQKSFEKLWFQKVGIWKNINNSPESGDTRYVYIKKY